MTVVRTMAALVVAFLAVGRGAAAQEAPPADGAGGARALAAEPVVERQTLQKLVSSDTWPRRALAAMRLERFGCAESEAMVRGLLADPAWQVRAFAVRTAGRRRLAIAPGAFDSEDEPLVLRAALRYRYAVDGQRIDRGARFLARSADLGQMLLAAELGAASGDPELMELAQETARTVILRMSRVEAGVLGPRLAALTGQADLRRATRWHRWLREQGNRYALRPAWGVPAEGSPAPGLLARLEPEHFSAMEGYVADLGRRTLDLAIAIDCTASMHAELAEAQGGIDDLMIFAGDVLASMRVAIVAYRDRRDEFEVRWWDFTDRIDEARTHLWSLSAAGGGDRPESVYEALRQAYTGLTWAPGGSRALVLVGDAPPHVGTGELSIDLARRAAVEGTLTTHVIQADTRPVKHLPEIAAAGGGRCVTLDRKDTGSLVVEIAGLTLGERFEREMREFFEVYLEMCR